MYLQSSIVLIVLLMKKENEHNWALVGLSSPNENFLLLHFVRISSRFLIGQDLSQQVDRWGMDYDYFVKFSSVDKASQYHEITVYVNLKE